MMYGYFMDDSCAQSPDFLLPLCSHQGLPQLFLPVAEGLC